jgi:hypothetical protein
MFTRGKQPCNNYTPSVDEFDIPNRHQCWGPYVDGKAQATCESTVSFCEHCCKDHHKHGWETCGGSHE